MASRTQVKSYLAHWFQLGKQVVSDDGQTVYQPAKVIQGDRFTPEFESCWQSILQHEGKALYLKGTTETIDQLLEPSWEIISCARCDMPVPIPTKEIAHRDCPCNDLPSWPNQEIPQPRLPINSQSHLGQISKRLRVNSEKDNARK